MKKFAITTVVCFGIIILLWIIGRITGTLQYYSITTPANEPALKIGQKIFTSNLKKIERYKFITFKSPYHDSAYSLFQSESPLGTHYLYRLCGIPGDIIQMQNGVLFVNNKNFDKFLDLKKQYKISKKDFFLIDEEDFPPDDSGEFIQIQDSAIVTFDSSLYKKYAASIRLVPFLITDINYSGDCFKWYNNNSAMWFIDNFGPLKVPSDNYFVLGDNRHNAVDSRFCGFIKKENITGVVLDK